MHVVIDVIVALHTILSVVYTETFNFTISKKQQDGQERQIFTFQKHLPYYTCFLYVVLRGAYPTTQCMTARAQFTSLLGN